MPPKLRLDELLVSSAGLAESRAQAKALNHERNSDFSWHRAARLTGPRFTAHDLAIAVAATRRGLVMRAVAEKFYPGPRFEHLHFGNLSRRHSWLGLSGASTGRLS
jgi:hypothetical protein